MCRIKKWIILPAAFSLLSVMFVGCSPSSESNIAAPRKTVPIHVTAVEERDVARHIESIGSLKPSNYVEVRPQVSGVLTEVLFAEGDVVSKGQPLFSIDERTYALKLEEVLAQQSQNEAAHLAKEQKWQRYNLLVEKNLIPRQEWEELTAQLAFSKAQLQADAARVNAAKLDLANCHITAPVSGKTGPINLHAGNLMSSSQAQALVSIAAVDQLDVEFTLTEQQFGQLQLGGSTEPIQVEVQAYGHPEISSVGELVFFNYGYDPKTGLLQLKGRINNQNSQFLAGQSVRVLVPIASATSMLVVPQRAIKINQTGPYVYKLSSDGASVELCPVTIGEEVGGDACILSGLTKEDQVVVEGHLRLHPGAAVNVLIEENS